MKKIVIIVLFLIVIVFVLFFIHNQDRKMIGNDFLGKDRAEFSFSFPDSLEEKCVEQYVDIIKKRLAFISHDDHVNVCLQGRDVMFSVLKDRLSEEDVVFLNTELLGNVELKFYNVLESGFSNKGKKGVIVPSNIGNMGNDDAFNLVVISPVPFLNLKTKDMSRFYLDTMKVNGAVIPVLRIVLNKPDSVLEKLSDLLEKKGGGMIYYRFNENSAGALYVIQKISDQFTIPLIDGDYERFLEMKYKYPLP